MEKFPFSEKEFCVIYVDCTRTRQSTEAFTRLLKVAEKNLKNIKNFETIVNILSQISLESYNDRDLSLKFFDRGFELLEDFTGLTFYTLKFIICIEKLVGLDTYSNEQYQKLQFKRFKPLFLCFTFELFHKHGLQK